jgi:hypothetical protein
MHRILERAMSTCLGMTMFVVVLWIILTVMYLMKGKELFPTKYVAVRAAIAKQKAETSAEISPNEGIELNPQEG